MITVFLGYSFEDPLIFTCKIISFIFKDGNKIISFPIPVPLSKLPHISPFKYMGSYFMNSNT